MSEPGPPPEVRPSAVANRTAAFGSNSGAAARARAFGRNATPTPRRERLGAGWRGGDGTDGPSTTVRGGRTAPWKADSPPRPIREVFAAPRGLRRASGAPPSDGAPERSSTGVSSSTRYVRGSSRVG